MNQRDRALLEDMKDFICMNRLATVLALCQTGAEPDAVTTAVMRGLYFPQGVKSQEQQSFLEERIKANTGSIQGIMTARMYAELFAGYEDLATFGSAIKQRAQKGIFERYATSETRVVASFLQEIYASDIPNHPEITLDHLLRLPSLAEINDHLPQEVLDQLRVYYRETPKYLYEVAKHYRLKREDAQSIRGIDLSSAAQQAHLPQRTMAIILGFVPETENVRGGRLSVDVFNRIKHQFLVTANLESYADATDRRSLEYVFLSREQIFIDGTIFGVASIAKVMGDLALILLLLDDRGIAL